MFTKAIAKQQEAVTTRFNVAEEIALALKWFSVFLNAFLHFIAMHADSDWESLPQSMQSYTKLKKCQFMKKHRRRPS